MALLTIWRESKLIAWEDQKGLCTICRMRIYLTEKRRDLQLVGHHKVSRFFNDHSASNCEARHRECEVWAHKHWRDGNPK